MSGGWAAKELCEKGLKTLVLERGRNVEHVKDYPTYNTNLWDLPNRGQLSYKTLQENPIGGNIPPELIGADIKNAAMQPGNWNFWMTGMGECLPYAENKVSLSADKKDNWGIPLLEIDCEYKKNELNMLDDILVSGSEMLEQAGFKNIHASDSKKAPGLGIHEMGTARMGRDQKTSVLNGHNQVWGAKNVFVTDGACMTSNACQNPLTYMALTARAADYAVSELNKRNL
jgi:choline dehydrogenase-like flavoprotein